MFSLLDELSLAAVLKDSTTFCEFVPRALALERDEYKEAYGDSNLFPELQAKAVDELAQMLTKMKGNRKDIQKNYREFLKKAAELRGDIAVKTGTPDAEKFGVVRKPNNGMECFDTYLYAPNYAKTNEKIKKWILLYISKLEKGSLSDRAMLGDSRYVIKLTRMKFDLDARLKVLNTWERQLGNKSFVESEKKNDLNENMFAEMVSDEYCKKQRVLLNRFHATKKWPILPVIDLYDPNTYVYCGRIEQKINGEWRVFTRHFAMIRCQPDGTIAPENLEHFKLNGFATLLHTNPEDFRHHDVPMAQLLDKFLDDKTPSEELPNLIRDFEYRLHHICYLMRGSAAMNETMIEAIKKACCPQYNAKGNLEALAQPFLTNYLKG